MRCITAICAAGPPKLSIATRVHTRTASPSETPWPATPGTGPLAASSDMSASPLFRPAVLHADVVLGGAGGARVIFHARPLRVGAGLAVVCLRRANVVGAKRRQHQRNRDRKSTRLNS